jgi:crotonobetainyl-CoA:carnitine CoA-transferase CaiB-like acyl-CoA transferase
MKLQGLRVIDLSVFLPGPYLSLALADHGAEVIKVEQPGEGDPGRHIGLSDGPSTVFFRNLNRGKKSVVLDLKTSEGREKLLHLADTADVFLEAFRPGVAARLGVDYATLSARNPRLVYCSISAFGQEGPYRERPAHDLAVEALAGVLSINLGTDDRPAMPGIVAADMLAGLQALSGVLMALFRRERTGCGDYLDISMHDVALAAIPNALGPTLAENRHPVAKEERSWGGSALYRLYETKDGRHLALGGQELKFVRNLLAALGRPEFIALCEQSVFRQVTLAYWVEWLKPLDVCFAPVNNLPEALADEHAAFRNAVLTDKLGRRHIAPAIRFQEEPARPVLREPSLGEHNAEFFPPPTKP